MGGCLMDDPLFEWTSVSDDRSGNRVFSIGDLRICRMANGLQLACDIRCQPARIALCHDGSISIERFFHQTFLPVFCPFVSSLAKKQMGPVSGPTMLQCMIVRQKML